MNGVTLAIPDISETYQASASLMGWVVNSFLLTSALFLLPFGRLADIVGRKKLFIPGLLLFCVFTYLCAFARTVEIFILFRVLQGISTALIFSTATALLASAYPPEERGKVLGISIAVVYFGLSIGPAAGGFLIFSFGWTSIFLTSATLCLIFFLLAAIAMKGDWTGDKGKPFDWKGSIIYMVGLAAFLYGLSSLSEHWTFGLIMLGGLLLLFFFVRHELRSEHPLLPLRLLSKNRVFAFCSMATLCNYSATFAKTFLMSIYLQSVLNFDSRAAGIVLLVQPIVMALIAPYAGSLSDRVDPKKLSPWGMAISTISLIIFSFLGINTPVYLIVAVLIFGGIGFGLFSSPTSNSIMGSVDKEMYGMASSALASLRMIGQSISMALAALVLGSVVGSVQLALVPPEQLLTAIRVAFAIFSVICLLGVVSLLRMSAKKEKQ